ncbi:MAG: LamG-like jellyroll fold domain-containing protein [Pirellulales bacterium]
MSTPTPDDELALLLKRLEQEELSAEERSRLNMLLRDDEAALEQFVRYQSTHALLAWRFAPFSAVDGQPSDVASPVGEAIASESSAHRDRMQRRNRLLAAAALFVGVTIGFALGRGMQEGSIEESIAQRHDQDPIATLTSVSRDVIWVGPRGRTLPVGTALGKGWINLDAGTVELSFSSGATVQLEGPASFAIDSPLRGFLNYGNIRVHAPESARDFAVGTASMEVVDLGTEFKLSVGRQSGASEIDVLEGLVDLHLSNAGRANRIQSLSTGQSADVDASGKITAIKGDKLDPLLLAHWRLDDHAEDSLVTDASRNHFHGRFNLPTSKRTLQGKTGRALALGANGYVDFSEHLSALANTRAFTLAAWLRNADDIVFSVSDGTERQRVQFELHGPWLFYGWQQGDYFDRISAGVSGWESDRWYHVAVSVSGGNVTIYRDGQALIEPRRTGGVINTRAIAPIDLVNPTVACLGRVPSNDVQQEQFLGGDLDDVQFYGRALDEVAIRYLFEHPGETLSLEQDR